jgi:Zn-dependent protease
LQVRFKLILAALTGAINHFLVKDPQSLIAFLLYTFATINISLAIFNLIPIPPLDGHKIVRGFLPGKLKYYWEGLEKYSLILILLLYYLFHPYKILYFHSLEIHLQQY